MKQQLKTKKKKKKIGQVIGLSEIGFPLKQLRPKLFPGSVGLVDGLRTEVMNRPRMSSDSRDEF